MNAVTVRCPAKVNLHLRVLGLRADGYHELRTLFASVGVWDEVEVRERPPGHLELAVEPAGSAPAGPENLVLRAAGALQARLPAPRGASIVLRKTVPTAAGLGGGSADAAATLVALAHLWGLDGSFAALAPLAAGLGADVPFFLLGGLAWGVGRGSEVYPLPDAPSWWAVLLPGPDPVPTATVYRALEPRGVDDGTGDAIYQWTIAGGELPLAACVNDLQPVVVAGWPEVGDRVAAILRTAPLLGQVSGSGGTVFGLYADKAAAERATGRLAAYRPLLAPVLPRAQARPRPSAPEA